MNKKYIKQVVDFTQQVIPNNWNLFINRDYVYKPGTLNIWLWIMDEIPQERVVGQEDIIGLVKGPMGFRKISICKGYDPKAAEALIKYGDGVIGYSEIQMNYSYLAEDTLMHELAHVAVQRLMAWQQRTYRIPNHNPFPYIQRKEEDPHGILFQKAYRRMIMRVEKIHGGERAEQMKVELNYYERGLHLDTGN